MFTYNTEAEIEAVVAGFESCTTDKAAFRHQDHLTVAVYYLQELNAEQAIVRMRTSLLRFVDHHKVDRGKYNETITAFWLKIIANQLQSSSVKQSLLRQCNEVIALFSDSSLTKQYYSTELLFSDKARQEFVAPDLRDLS